MGLVALPVSGQEPGVLALLMEGRMRRDANCDAGERHPQGLGSWRTEERMRATGLGSGCRGPRWARGGAGGQEGGMPRGRPLVPDASRRACPGMAVDTCVCPEPDTWPHVQETREAVLSLRGCCPCSVEGPGGDPQRGLVCVSLHSSGGGGA